MNHVTLCELWDNWRKMYLANAKEDLEQQVAWEAMAGKAMTRLVCYEAEIVATERRRHDHQ